MREIKQGDTTSIRLFFNTTDGKTGATAITPTIGFALPGAGFTTVAAPASTEIDFGWFDVALTTAHTNTLGEVALHSTGAGQDPMDFKYLVVPADWGDVSEIHSAELGHWTLDTTANTLTMFKAGDTTTSIQVFNLTTVTGTIPGYIARST
jgi:hypothetical protein